MLKYTYLDHIRAHRSGGVQVAKARVDVVLSGHSRSEHFLHHLASIVGAPYVRLEMRFVSADMKQIVRNLSVLGAQLICLKAGLPLPDADVVAVKLHRPTATTLTRICLQKGLSITNPI